MAKLDFSILDAIRDNKPPIRGITPPVTSKAATDEIKAITDEYRQRINQCFDDAHKFMLENAQLRTDADFERIVSKLPQYTDPLTVELVV